MVPDVGMAAAGPPAAGPDEAAPTAGAPVDVPPPYQLPPHRRAVRAGGGRLVGGVAAGIAAHLGVPRLLVRLAFVVLCFAGGIGILLYGVFWLVLPQSAGAEAPARDRGQLLALAAVGGGGALLLNGVGLLSPLLLPVVVAVVGVALVWQQADAAQRARWRVAGNGRSRLVAVLAGAALLAIGITGFLASIGQLGQARDGLLSTGVVVAGLAVLTGPWWLRLSADLRAERRERIRSQERAEVAAHVHDSVLQTLALIRKAADDPREVSRLARTQERELRTWLYAPSGAGPEQPTTFAGALGQVVDEVESTTGVTVETVVVGDAAPSARTQAVVAATREALGNAARHSGVRTVSLYAEADAQGVEVFVRDRGVGFDAALVPPDRFGVAQSIVGRLQRHGGVAVVTSRPGHGTEVHLQVRNG